MKTIEASDLAALSMGSVFLATGGGGDPWLSVVLAEEALAKHGPVPLIDPDKLKNDDVVVAVGGVGAPSVSLEMLPSLTEPMNAVRAFEIQTDINVSALISFEIGGANSLMPLQAAAMLGYPVIDGDGMGRALPEAQMMTFAIHGIAPTPALAMDFAGNTRLFQNLDSTSYEIQLRQWTELHGGMVTTVEHPMSRNTLKQAMVPGSLSFALEIGQHLLDHQGHVEALLEQLRASFQSSIYGRFVVFGSGQVQRVERRVEGGFDVGRIALSPLEEKKRGLPFELFVKNEFIQLNQADRVLATVPDLIVALDLESGEPLNAERIAYGQRLVLLGIGAPPHYRTDAALQVVSPACFGLKAPYRPL